MQGFKIGEIRMMDDDGFGASPFTIPFAGMYRDHMHNLVRDSFVKSQTDPGKRMPEELALCGFYKLTVLLDVLQNFAHIVK